jgi:hypothetical protein
MNGYYREGNVSPLLSACKNWKSVFVAFLNAHNSESVLEVYPQGSEIAYQIRW